MRRFAALALALVLAGCAGPKEPLEVGVKEFPTKVLFGQTARPLPPPVLSQNPVPAFPGFLQPPPPRFRIPEVEIRPLCPTAHPFSAPRHVAGNRALHPPVEADYLFRNQGKFSVGSLSGDYPKLSRRSITNVISGEDEFTFDVVIELAGTVTTTTYRVVPQSVFPPSAGTPPDSGVFIVRVVTESPDGPDVFAPTPALPLILFPAGPGVQWDARGIDPFSQTVMQFHGAVTGKARVDACGTVLDGWLVETSAGSITGPTKDLVFTASYVIGTQFGGFSLMDRVEISGVDGGEEVSSLNEATIFREPKLPAS